MEKSLKNIVHLVIKNIKWIIALIVTAIFLAIAEDVFKKEIFEFDSVIYNFLVSKRNIYINKFFEIITNFGGTICIVIVTLVSTILIKKKKYKIIIPLNLVISTLLNFSLKNLFERTRPDNMRLIEETGYSFPSGHAMVSTAVYGYLIYIAYKNIKNKRLRNLCCYILSVLILFICISRIYVGVHYVSDVIAGTCFSIMYLIVLTHITKEANAKKS